MQISIEPVQRYRKKLQLEILRDLNTFDITPDSLGRSKKDNGFIEIPEKSHVNKK
jgi:hypothetical protein